MLLGASGAVGRAVLARLREGEREVVAISRAPPVEPGWRRGDLNSGMPELRCECLISAGPLAQLVDWLRRAPIVGLRRVVVLSSTSAHVKQHSSDADERALAQRLMAAEAGLRAYGAVHGVRWTVLRPTLIYGGAGERNLSRLVAVAKRLGVLPLPQSAQGLRQPVHAEDVAAALIAALDCAPSHDRSYDLPGGETLSYADMAARVLGCLHPPRRVWRLPVPMARAGFALARALGVLREANQAMFERLAEDLVFDAAPAARDLGYAPRPFAPTRAMFEPAGSA